MRVRLDMWRRWWERSLWGGMEETDKRGDRRERDGGRWDREKSGGWMEARSWLRAKGRKKRRDTPREGRGPRDGKTVIGSESEDNYNDRGWVGAWGEGAGGAAA